MKLARSTLTAIAPVQHDRVAPVAPPIAPLIDAPAAGQADGTAQAASEALATLEAVRRSGSDGGKARAAARIAELKTRLHLLKLLYAADAEKLAQAAVQIARELAEAVQDYVGAGGTAFAMQGTDVTIVGGANLTPTPAPAEDVPMQDPAGAGRGDATATPAAGSEAKTRSEAGRRDSAAHPDDGAEDVAFANAARALANELRAILRHAERQHGADDHDAARGRLNDIDRAMAAMTQMPAAYDAAIARLASVASVASGAATIFARD